jgi:hypothetical protein
MSDIMQSIAVPSKAKRKLAKASGGAVAANGAGSKNAVASLPVRRAPAEASSRPQHAYRPGERASLATIRGYTMCTIVRQLPIDLGVVLYRVKSDGEDYERNVEESALS